MKLTDAELEDWALAMESGRYKYGAGILYDGKCHCALGVLLVENGYEFKPVPEYTDKFEVVKDGISLEDDTGYGVLDDLLGSDKTVKEVYRANDYADVDDIHRGYHKAIKYVRGLKKNG